MYSALVDEGVLNDMKKRGIEVVFVYGVDNVMVKIADPLFVGCFIDSKAEVGSKVVPKASADERGLLHFISFYYLSFILKPILLMMVG